MLRWLNGTGEPRLSEAVRLAEFFGLTLSELAGLDATAPAPGPELTVDQRTILQVVEDLGLTRREAIRRLAGPPQIDEEWRPEGGGRARLVGNGGPASGSSGVPGLPPGGTSPR